VLLVVALGALAAIAFFAVLSPQLAKVFDDPLRLIIFTVVVCILQYVAVDIYGRGHYSFSSAGLMAMGFAVSPAAGMAVAVLNGVLRFARTGLFYRAVFDSAQFALACGISTSVYLLLAGSSTMTGATIVWTLLAGLVFYAVNTGLLSLAMSVEEGSSLIGVWKERFQWMLPYTAVAGPLAGGLVIAYERIGVLGLALFTLPPVFMIFSVRQYLNRTRESVDEIRKVNKQLAESEEHFRSLIEDASDAIAVVDADGTLSYGSPALERLLGRSLDEVIGQRALRMLDAEARRTAAAGLIKHLKRGSSEPFELRFKRKGQEIISEVQGRRFDDGGTTRTVITVRDVTARKMTEEALERSEQQLQHSQRLEAVGRLAGGVAHDFNNLLTVMMGCSEFLLLQLDEDDPRRAEADEIQRAAQRAAALTRQLLAFSRKQVLEPRPLDLNSSLNEMEGMLTRLLGAEIELETKTELDVAPVFADPGQIEQVVVNLVVNARDAMGDQGQVCVSVRELEIGEQLPGELESGDYIVLSVSDTGEGIDEEKQGQIFEPFFTTKEVGKGTGLGLSTVYGIVKQTGGEIGLQSVVGEGTTFSIYLPRYDGPIIGEEVVVPILSTNVDATILLVDDDDAVRRIAVTVLEEHGYRVLSARNGLDALELARAFNRPLDLLLTDIVMPEMTGAALALHLRAERPDMQILYMSGHIGEATFEENGPPLLNKPFRGSALLTAVQSALSSRQDAPLAFDADGNGKAAPIVAAETALAVETVDSVDSQSH
jgi:PAS domain S-box-containing protein